MPCFLVHAKDDVAVLLGNTRLFRNPLRGFGTTAETHLFAEGSHGFDLRLAAGKACAIWPELWLSFANSNGLME